MNDISLEKIQALRKLYLGETSFASSYWKDQELIESYDAVLGERIRWKWATALSSLSFCTNNFSLVDFGCGTGSAFQTFLTTFPNFLPTSINLLDKDSLVLNFAQKKAKELFPNITVTTSIQKTIPQNPYVVLVSHVLNELNTTDKKFLQTLLEKSDAFIWLEPGAQKQSQELISFRESVSSLFEWVAPCPHQQTCGLLQGNPTNAWCHFFAEPPQAIFHSAFWRKISLELKIDLRSLPFSYLVAQKKNTSWFKSQASEVAKLGRPKLYKGYWLETHCESEGVSVRKFLQRENPERYKKIKNSKHY